MPRSSSLPYPPRTKAREGTARLFSFISTEIEGARVRCPVLLLHFHREQRRERTPRSSSLPFPPRSKARENDARLFSFISSEIKGAEERRVVLLLHFLRDRRRGRTLRGSSPSFPLRSKARENAARFFSPVSTEIEGAGERRTVLLLHFHRDRRRERMTRTDTEKFSFQNVQSATKNVIII